MEARPALRFGYEPIKDQAQQVSFDIPVLIRMYDLQSNQNPRSDVPDFWDVWTRSDKGKRDVDWKMIADDWHGKTDDDNKS